MEIIESIAIIAASLSAVYGIFSWRREIEWRKKYEIAKEALALFYEARDMINAIRSPLSGSEEGQSRKSDSEETPKEKKILDRAYVVYERYKNNQEVFNKLYSLRYRFMVYFGQDKGKLFEDLKYTIAEILSASNRLARFWSKGIRNEWVEKDENIMWKDYESSDPIDKKVEEIISKIEDIYNNVIKPGSWFSKILKKNNRLERRR